MSEANKKTKLSLLLMASLITTNLVFAGDAYKNNVVDVKVNKESSNAVKVTIYTDKPYTEPVVVNKKANNKYVILMPETKSSLKNAPSVTNVAGTVSDVSVNTQAVSGGKGYTKIVITSEKAITVVPRMQQLSTVPKTTSAPVNSTQKPAIDTAAQKTQQEILKAKQLAEQKAQQEAKAKQLAAQKAAAEKARLEAAKKQKAQQEAAAKRLAEQRAAQERAKQIAAQKAAAEKAKQQAAQQSAPKTESVPVSQSVQTTKPAVKQPIEILEQEVQTDKNAKFTQNTNDPVLNQEIKDNIEKKKQRQLASKKKKNVIHETNGNASVIENIKAVIRDYQNVSIWKLLLLASAITFPIVVIMVILGMDKKINKRIDNSFRKEEEPVIDSMYVSEDVVPVSDEPSVQSFQSFDEMLDKVEEPIQTYHEEQFKNADFEPYDDSDVVPVSDVEIEPEFENDFENDDFVLEYVNDDEVVPQVETQSTVDLIEPAVSTPAVVESVSSEPVVPYAPDGYLSDFSSVSDKDFFDELVLQSMAENNIDGLPEETPADDIFNYMNEENLESIANKQQLQVSESVSENNILSSDLIQEMAAAKTQNFDQQVVNEHVVQTIPESVVEESEEDENLTMLTEVKLSENTGLYLVNYDDFTSLVGHIGDEYFVIKKFDEFVNASIVLKQTEKVKDSTRYLVRVGKNKMIVEVTPTSMSRLLDL